MTREPPQRTVESCGRVYHGWWNRFIKLWRWMIGRA